MFLNWPIPIAVLVKINLPFWHPQILMGVTDGRRERSTAQSGLGREREVNSGCMLAEKCRDKTDILTVKGRDKTRFLQLQPGRR